MKKYLILLLAVFLVFGFSSATLASGDHHNNDSTHEKVTYHKGVTTIVTTTKTVKHDKIVKTDKKVDYYTEKKHNKSTFNKTEVTKTKEHHPQHDWYRFVEIATTYKITKHETWDEVKKVTTYTTKTTPVKIVKTTVRTVKYYGKPGHLGKKISDETKVYVDKKFGKTKVEVTKEVEFFKKNYKTYYDKEVIDVKKTYGKWIKDDDWKDDNGKDKDKDKDNGKGHGKGKDKDNGKDES